MSSPEVPDSVEPEAPDSVELGAPEPADGLVEAVLVPPKGLVPTVLLLMVGVAAAAVLWPAPLRPSVRPELRLDTWQEGAEALAASRERALGSHRPDPVEAGIARDLAVWLAMEATRGHAAVAADPRARAHLGGLEERVRRLSLSRGREGLSQAAGAWAREVRRRFEADVGAALQSGEDLRRALASGRLQQAAPGLGPTLIDAGVHHWRQGPGLSPGARLVVEGLAEQRYLALARRVPRPRPELGSRLATLVLRFRVEAHAGLDLRRRLQLAERLIERDPAWPRAYATGVLLARAGRYRGARAWFLKAAAQGERPALARRNARWCRQQLRLARRAEASRT